MGVKTMFNFVLFMKALKSNYKLILIFMGVLAMYMSIIIGMYDPEDLDILNQLASLKLSPELLNAMGFTLMDTSLIGFISSYFYGFLMLAFPMICYIILGNKIVASLVDKGSMASILATPNTRISVALTQGVFLLTTITGLIEFVFIWGIFYCSANLSGMLDIKAFILLNIGVLLLHYAISGICFFSSCLFNESRNSLMLGAGVPIAFLLLQMLSNANKEIEVFRLLTIFSLFQPTKLIAGENILPQIISLVSITIVLYLGGVIAFNKKDLPL